MVTCGVRVRDWVGVKQQDPLAGECTLQSKQSCGLPAADSSILAFQAWNRPRHLASNNGCIDAEQTLHTSLAMLMACQYMPDA